MKRLYRIHRRMVLLTLADLVILLNEPLRVMGLGLVLVSEKLFDWATDEGET